MKKTVYPRAKLEWLWPRYHGPKLPKFHVPRWKKFHGFYANRTNKSINQYNFKMHWWVCHRGVSASWGNLSNRPQMLCDGILSWWK